MTILDIGRAASAGRARRSIGLLARLAGFFRMWSERRRARQTLFALAQMNVHLLRDIGIEPGDVRDAIDGLPGPLLFRPSGWENQ